jgi:hypothetical protein
MDRPTIDLSRGIPKSPEDWEWREYADWLEAERAKLRQEIEGRDMLLKALMESDVSEWKCKYCGETDITKQAHSKVCQSCAKDIHIKNAEAKISEQAERIAELEAEDEH